MNATGPLATTMIAAYQAAQAQKKKSGCPPAFTLQEQIIFTLEFWREYPSMFHHGFEWGIHETTAIRTVRHVEDALITSGLFSLPSKQQTRIARTSGSLSGDCRRGGNAD